MQYAVFVTESKGRMAAGEDAEMVFILMRFIYSSVIPHVVARNSLFNIFIFGETF